eukprot:9307557-Alexandrium_andersonii.AAC.1
MCIRDSTPASGEQGVTFQKASFGSGDDQATEMAEYEVVWMKPGATMQDGLAVAKEFEGTAGIICDARKSI